jgi:hypothetical protein
MYILDIGVRYEGDGAHVVPVDVYCDSIVEVTIYSWSHIQF